ncbi:hypothetical protein SAMN05192583_0577 [Sphingomonas gellani]|uniref:Transcription antitermination factor NusG n=1 Tax=Sphingomonas gellani TaxID=1166340 RepID=A0A1H7ZAI3_9SPHN|nr:hypothetical protein [Sphingomonas gellani]SEM54568.1 hypothetical protein SAMN05192583_0577 [Sphingomonas gellani]
MGRASGGIADQATNRWCILRTSGGRTLALADFLIAAGLEAWTPRKTFKRDKPGRCRLIDGRKPTVEIAAAILPTFVFARARHLPALADMLADPASLHPPFSIFRHAGRIPEVGSAEVQGLRNEEAAAAELLRQRRDAESRAEADAVRIAAIKSEEARRRAIRQAEHERRMALRKEVRTLSAGDQVDVTQMPSLAGLVGTVVEGYGNCALVSFGGALAMKIEAWRLSPHDVDSVAA